MADRDGPRDLVFVIPAYNAGPALAEVVAGIRAVADVPLWVVDDGSTDGCCDNLPGGVRVLTHAANRGKGAALKTAFVAALRDGYRSVGTLDADGQHPPSMVPAFVSAAEREPDALLLGVRLEIEDRAPWPSRHGNRVSRILVNKLLGRDLPDVQCGMRVYPADFLRAMTASGDRYEFETEALLEAGRLGVPILALPIPTHYGDERRTHFRRGADSFRVLRALVRAGWR